MENNYREELVQVAAVALAALQDDIHGTTMLRHRNHVWEGDDNLEEILYTVSKERVRQETKWGAQHHSKEHWLTILMEEVGEVARDILENP